MGHHYFEKYAPIERILSVLKQAQQTGKRLTIQDIQASEGLEPTEMSGAIGTLKKEGAIRIVAGGIVEATGGASRTSESLRALLQQLHGGARDLSTFPDTMRDVIKQHAVKRGNAREPFRLDERPDRAYVLTSEGEAIQALLKGGVAEEVSQFTPELLKDGAWRNKRFRKYSISLRPPRIGRRETSSLSRVSRSGEIQVRRHGLSGNAEDHSSRPSSGIWTACICPNFIRHATIHDVYFVKEPTHARSRTRIHFWTASPQAHENGGDTGSTGWGYVRYANARSGSCFVAKARRVRAHLGVDTFDTGKVFSIARCFRYDQVDATHAPDFFQVEGIVLGEAINSARSLAS